jgi:predicted nucleic acid-binding protein
LILDTGVLVAAVRGCSMVPEKADVAIPAIVVAEYLLRPEKGLSL